MAIFVIIHDGDVVGYIIASNLSAAKKKINKMSKDSDDYLPTADMFDEIVEVKKYK